MEKSESVTHIYVIVGEKSHTFPIDALVQYPDTFLGRRAFTLLSKDQQYTYKDMTIDDSGSVARFLIYYTPRYFEDMRDFFYTGCLRIPSLEEKDLFYAVLDYWGIHIEEQIFHSPVKEMMTFLRDDFSQAIRGAKGDTGPQGHIGSTRVMGSRGAPLNTQRTSFSSGLAEY